MAHYQFGDLVNNEGCAALRAVAGWLASESVSELPISWLHVDADKAVGEDCSLQDSVFKESVDGQVFFLLLLVRCF